MMRKGQRLLHIMLNLNKINNIMGTIQHKTLVITCSDRIKCKKLKSKIKRNIRDQCFLGNVFEGPINGYVSFCFYTCGSKLGWSEDVKHEKNIEMVIKLIKEYDYEDGSNPFDYVYVSYGDCGAEIVKTNCQNMF
jgi:hypothetical protein